jgi:hypothetical protein
MSETVVLSPKLWSFFALLEDKQWREIRGLAYDLNIPLQKMEKVCDLLTPILLERKRDNVRLIGLTDGIKKATVKCLVFRVRKKYFDDIVSGEKNIEYRKDSPFWQKRVWEGKANCWRDLRGLGWVGVFICGKRVHRRELTRVERRQTPGWFSEQGKRDVDTPACLAFFLGKVVKQNHRAI